MTLLLARAVARSKLGAASTIIEKLAEESKACVFNFISTCSIVNDDYLGTSIHRGSMQFVSFGYHLLLKMHRLLRKMLH